MTYPTLRLDKPVWDATDDGVVSFQYLRDNLMIIVHNIVAHGVCVGWNRLDAGGMSFQPATRTWSNGTNRVRCSLTWGTTGGANGNVTENIVDYSADSGATWQRIGTYTPTWAADGTSPSDSWS